MAVVNSTALGAAVKTAGELTYRRTRGRTIASRRIVSNKSKTQSQISQRSAFGVLGKAAKDLSGWIDTHFEQTKYGTPRNNFVKQNTPVMHVIRADNGNIGGDGLYAIVKAIKVGATVFAGYGRNLTTFEVDAKTEHELKLSILFSKQLSIGDQVTIIVVKAVTQLVNGNEMYFNSYKEMSYVVTEADANVNAVSIDKVKVPGLSGYDTGDDKYEAVEYAIAVAVLSGTDKSISTFNPIIRVENPDENPDIL